MIRSILVNALVIREITGKESYRLFHPGPCDLAPGDQVRLVECTINDGLPTGFELVRYIEAVEPYYKHPCYESAVYLHLSPFKPDRSELGLSRVRNSDNLESF